MTDKCVDFYSKTKLDCPDCLPVDAILCIPPELLLSGLETISATLIASCILNQTCGTIYKYTFQYDDALLIDGAKLISTNITGAFCLNCLTTWVLEKIDIASDPFSVTDTNSVNLTVNPDFPQVLSADVKISADADNIISIHSDGIYAACCEEELLAVTDTNSVDLTISGSIPQTLSADVKISADGGNSISIHSDGIYAATGGGGSGWDLLGNAGTVAGTNFIGTTDNVAHDVRVNNFRSRRTEPTAEMSNILDTDDQVILGPGSVIGCTIGGGGTDSINNTPHEIDAGYYSTIAGGSGNLMIPDSTPNGDGFASGYSFIGGGFINIVELDVIPWGTIPPAEGANFQGAAVIGGGFDNLIICTDYGTIGGGSVNQIAYQRDNPPSDPVAVSWCACDTIGGGESNQILGFYTHTIDKLGFNFVGGGTSNEIDNSFGSVICGGSRSFNGPSGSSTDPNPVGAFNFIGGGSRHSIDESHSTSGLRNSIVGGGFNTIDASDSSHILGGYLNYISSSTIIVLPDATGGFQDFDPLDTAGICNIIVGGEANVILDGKCSTHLGGAFLQIGVASTGYQSPLTRTMLNGLTRPNFSPSRTRFPTPQVDVSAFSGISYWGDVDIWVANTNSTATKVKFFEPNSVLDFSTTNYSSFQAQTQSANIEYIWPAAAGTAGQQLTIDTVVGTVVTLKWA